MRKTLSIVAVLTFPLLLPGQTAADLVAKNLQARGGVDKIKAIRTLRMTGLMQQGGFMATVTRTSMAPHFFRETFTVQGMTQIQSYDGSQGWKISPFEGRKDAELLGEDDLRGVVEDADFYGPLIDYATKDNRIEYLGHDIVDGDDAYRLKVTLANGDIIYYYLDPDSYLEIRTEKMEFIRGAVRESVTNLGSYKRVAGVYFPFALEFGGMRQDPSQFAKVTIDKIEANVPLDETLFRMPAAKPAGGGSKDAAPRRERPARGGY
jgi:hypothetical protein